VSGNGQRRSPNGVGYPQRELEGGPSLFTPNDDLPLAAHRMHEALKLQGQGIGLWCLQDDPLYYVSELSAGPRLPTLTQAHELACPGSQIEREISVRLKQPEPSYPVTRDPRRGGECDCAIREFHSRVCDVQMG
jgi:hypothetical protein